MIRKSRQATAFVLSGTSAFNIGTTIYPGAINARDLAEAIDMARG